MFPSSPSLAPAITSRVIDRSFLGLTIDPAAFRRGIDEAPETGASSSRSS
jgi:hypothetical protein